MTRDKNALLRKIPYLGLLSRSLGLNDAPWRHSLDNIGESVPDTHCDRWKDSQWRVVVSIEVSFVDSSFRAEEVGTAHSKGHEFKLIIEAF